jgi:protein-tyrosine phosphatase
MERFRVCFVCSGNICRSPMAECVLRGMARAAGCESALTVDSAGTGAWHAGEGADRGAVRALTRRGYECHRHLARQFQPSWFAARDLVVALDRGHERELRAMASSSEAAAKVRLLRSFDPAAGADLDVPDPYYGGPGDFDYCLDLIEAACPSVLAHVAGARMIDSSGTSDRQLRPHR